MTREAPGAGEADADELAFESWYLRTWPGLASFLVLRVDGDRAVAADLAAEAMARAYERWSDCRPHDPTAWVFTVAVNLSRRHHRRQLHERRILSRLFGRPESAGPSPEPELEQAVLALPPRQRDVITLRDYADLTQPAIAELLGISVGSVSSSLTEARRSLRASLSPPDRRSNGSDD